MPEIREISVATLDLTQATKLSVLVDLEARWENMRKTQSQPPQQAAAKQDLEGIQKAYQAFRDKLAAYNRQYTPAHVPELLLNTPARLGKWCRTMRDLYSRLGQDPRGHCPVHVLEKAYRSADRISIRTNKDRLSRSTAPSTIETAVLELEALCRWCDAMEKDVPRE
jgi:hypothetical protein